MISFDSHRRSPHGAVPSSLRRPNLCHDPNVRHGNAVLATLHGAEMGIGVVILALLVAWWVFFFPSPLFFCSFILQGNEMTKVLERKGGGNTGAN